MTACQRPHTGNTVTHPALRMRSAAAPLPPPTTTRGCRWLLGLRPHLRCRAQVSTCRAPLLLPLLLSLQSAAPRRCACDHGRTAAATMLARQLRLLTRASLLQRREPAEAHVGPLRHPTLPVCVHWRAGRALARGACIGGSKLLVVVLVGRWPRRCPRWWCGSRACGRRRPRRPSPQPRVCAARRVARQRMPRTPCQPPPLKARAQAAAAALH
jgi:hypothetical protein